MGVDVKPLPGLEQLPYAEVWLRSPDEALWREASEAAHAIGKDGLEVWTTDETPEVATFLEARAYELHRSYVVSELDVTAAPDPGPPGVELTTFAERPDLAEALYAVACEAYPDQPGRAETRMSPFEVWRSWGLDPHEPTAYFVALDGEQCSATATWRSRERRRRTASWGSHATRAAVGSQARSNARRSTGRRHMGCARSERQTRCGSSRCSR